MPPIVAQIDVSSAPQPPIAPAPSPTPNSLSTAPQPSETLPITQIQPAPGSAIAIAPTPVSAIAPTTTVGSTPQQNLAFLIGDLLGAKTSINQDSQTQDLSIKLTR